MGKTSRNKYQNGTETSSVKLRHGASFMYVPLSPREVTPGETLAMERRIAHRDSDSDSDQDSDTDSDIDSNRMAASQMINRDIDIDRDKERETSSRCGGEIERRKTNWSEGGAGTMYDAQWAAVQMNRERNKERETESERDSVQRDTGRD